MSDDMYSEVLEAARQNWWEVYSGVVPFREESILDWLSEDRAQERLQRISSRLGQDLSGLAMLEVGSGFGAFVRASQRRGISCYGIDPDPTACRASARWISAGSGKSSVVRAVGESLPFSSETFDIVASFQVLEHTEDPAKVLRESIRVLREGGVLHFVVPNYKSFWEGHYGLYWLPLLPKRLAKLYVRLCGRAPAFLDTINYVTPKTIRDSLSDQNVRILSLGAEIWQKRLQSLQFPTWGRAERLLPPVRLAHRLRTIRLVTYLGVRFELYFPIVLTARKVGSQRPCLTIQDRGGCQGVQDREYTNLNGLGGQNRTRVKQQRAA